MEEKLNVYGDKMVDTTGAHGADIASQRMDDLDQACMDFVADRLYVGRPPNAVDIGGGSGAMAKRMAAAGANVLMVDLSDQTANIEAASRSLVNPSALAFVQADVNAVPDESWPKPIHLVFSQRTLHYLPYARARQFLVKMRTLCAPEARFFLSTGGLRTEYGVTYPDRNKKPQDRFACLAPDMAEKHHIHAPQCLYTIEDLIEQVEGAGLRVLKGWESSFGNTKLIAGMKNG